MSTNADYNIEGGQIQRGGSSGKEGEKGPKVVSLSLMFLHPTPQNSLKLSEIIIASLLRFDPLCGEFNDKLFKESYQFVNEVKSRELVELKKQLKTEEDKERREEVGGKEKAKIAHICNFSKLFMVVKDSWLSS